MRLGYLKAKVLMFYKGLRHSWYLWLSLLLLLVIGFVISGNYGFTTDDLGLREYANHVLRLYTEAIHGSVSSDPGPANLRYYGPAFLLGEKILEVVLTRLDTATIWHFSVFLVFLLGAAALFYICRFFFSSVISYITTALFIAQPMLWGHAFINAKDIPFMGFFLLSIALGLHIEQTIPSPKTFSRKTKRRSALEEALSEIPRDFVHFLVLAIAVLIIFAVVLVLFPGWAHSTAEFIIQYAAGNPHSLAGKLFEQLATNRTTVELRAYVDKLSIFLVNTFFLLILISWLVLFTLLIRRMPVSFNRFKTYLHSLPWKNSASLRSVIIAGLALAITTAIRVAGPYAGILVGIYLVLKKGRYAIPSLLLYIVIGSIGTYLLWPYLWSAPLQNAIKSVTVMSDFPQPHSQLLNGIIYSSEELPFYFVPELITLQLNLPALALIFSGIVLTLSRMIRFHKADPLIWSLAIWVGLPIVFLITFRPSLYNNFRQWLFILPPLFVFAGFGIEFFVHHLREDISIAVVLVVILGAGLIPIVQLHPYEYAYYNLLAGGFANVEGKFELDYWGTALTNAGRQLNRIAPLNSKIVVWGNEGPVLLVARNDFVIERNRGGTRDPETGYDFAAIAQSSSHDLKLVYPNKETIIEVTQQGIVLAIVKELK